MAPLPGEQILTVLSTVAVQTADATFAEARKRVAARKMRSEITWAPFHNRKISFKRALQGAKLAAIGG